MTSKQNHLLILCITGYLAMAGGALLAPALPEMILPLRIPAQAAGLLMSVFTFSTAISTLVLGHFIDRVDRKKILVPGLILFGLAGVVSFFITDFSALLAVRFIQGIGVASMMTLAFLIIGDIYPGHESIGAIGKMGMSLAIGAISAPLIGGLLAGLAWNYPFLFYALSLPFALVVALLLPETREKQQNAAKPGIRALLPEFQKFSTLYPVFMGFSVFFLLYSLIIYVPFMLRDTFGFSSGGAGLLLSVEGIAVVVLASRVGSLSARYSLTGIAATGFLLLGLTMASIPFTGSIVVIFLLLILFGAGYGLAQTAIDARIIQVSPSSSRGVILSVHTSMKYIGMSASPIVFGIVLSLSDMTTVFLVAGVFGLIMAVMSFGVKHRFNFPQQTAS